MQNASALLFNNPEFGSFEFPTFRKFFVSVSDHILPHARNNYHPHLLSHRMLGLLTLLLMTVKIVSVALIAVAPVAEVSALAITTETVISQTNASRAENQIPALAANQLLTRAAQNKANDMLARQYFAHNTPDGATPWTFIKDVGYSYVTAGENLAIDFSEAESVQAAWMNSPGHRANILNKSFQEIGIGIAKGTFDGHDTIIVVQMFGTPIAQQVSVQEQPTVVSSAPAPVQPVVSAAPASEPVVQTAAPTVESPVPLDIVGTNVALQGDNLYVSVTATASAVKVLAIYGSQSIMLSPLENNIWHGKISLSKISAHDNLVVQAYDINDKIHQEPVVQFSETLKSTMPKGNVEGVSVKVFGTEINPSLLEQKIILIVLALILAALVLTIAVKRHVQHVSLIANTSFVAMLAAILLMT